MLKRSANKWPRWNLRFTQLQFLITSQHERFGLSVFLLPHETDTDTGLDVGGEPLIGRVLLMERQCLAQHRFGLDEFFLARQILAKCAQSGGIRWWRSVVTLWNCRHCLTKQW